jgi:Na+/melibiose symporter-like transporter
MWFLPIFYIPIRAGVTMYYLRYYVENEALAPTFMVSGTVMTMIGVTSSSWLTRRFGKRNAYIGCMLVIALTLALHFFVRPSDVVLLFFHSLDDEKLDRIQKELEGRRVATA